MSIPTQNQIIHLKKTLNFTIQKNAYNLLSPEVLQLSMQLDLLLNPLFEKQLENTYKVS